MLSYEDCVGLCGLTEEEIRAIAEHEHVPEIIALEIGHYLLHQPDGPHRIKRMILDDFAAAKMRRDSGRVRMWRGVFRQFVHNHPRRPLRSARHDLAIEVPGGMPEHRDDDRKAQQRWN
jgi:hypothetical protein